MTHGYRLAQEFKLIRVITPTIVLHNTAGQVKGGLRGNPALLAEQKDFIY